MPMVVKNFVAALMEYAANVKQQRITEVHVVDVDASLIRAVKDEFRTLTSDVRGATSVRSQQPRYPIVYPDKANGWLECTDSFGDYAKPGAKPPTGNQCFQCKNKPGAKKFTCVHEYCKECSKSWKSCPNCDNKVQTTKQDKKGKVDCSICCETVTSLEVLPCSHQYCKACIDRLKQTTPKCPECQHPFGIITGNQPQGKMFHRTMKESLPGYSKCGTIHVFYDILPGKQGVCLMQSSF